MAPRGPPYGIPEGFPDFLQRFVVHVLKNQPENLAECAIKYFSSIDESQKQSQDQSVKVGNSKVMSYLNVSHNDNNDADSPLQINQMSECLLAASQNAFSQQDLQPTGVSSKLLTPIAGKNDGLQLPFLFRLYLVLNLIRNPKFSNLQA